jgi:tetratricopeptide (TPR) repeat protein
MLARDILTLIESDGYGVFDELPEAASPALGKEGRAALREMLLERQASLSDAERRRFDYMAGWLLPKLADLDDDVDAYIATVDPDRRNALLNAKVAQRLIAHGRYEEALGWIDAPTERGHNERELADLRLRAFVALGRREEAQAQRKAIFDRWLDSQALRDWLRNLPDFEDFDAERQALDQAMTFDPGVRALAFLVEWPDLGRAGQLIRSRLDGLDGRAYDVLRPCAEALASSDPVGATLLYRRLVTGVLDRGASKYYPYAVRDYVAAGKLADGIEADAGIMAHADWVDLLRRSHGRKIGFWSQIPV